jgi:ElaB/YqjD/DUF883 family membrane-anchored ribosome-binding protein
MKEKAMEVPRTLTRTIDEAGAGPHPAIERASDAASAVVDRFASGTHRAVDKIADAAAQAVNTLGVKGEELKGAQVRVMDACRSSVREHPVASLAIALAAGFVLSRLMRSRSGSDPAA